MKVVLAILFSLSVSFTAKKQKIVFFGDSITQMGVKEGGYIDLVNKHIKKNNLENSYEVIGAGIGGNKVYDLYLRLDEVFDQKPDVVVIYIGINDVWHKTSHGTGTDPDKYLRFYNRIIDKLEAQSIKVVVCTPTVIGERNDASNPQDGDLNHYSNMIRKLAGERKLNLIDLRKSFLTHLENNNPENNDKGILTYDRVHLNEKGNAFLADIMIKQLIK